MGQIQRIADSEYAVYKEDVAALNMITKGLIADGIRSNLVRFVVDPNMESGTVCQIGDSWFYFGGLTAEETSPEEYLATVPMEDIVDEIFDVLEGFREAEEYADEYDYYWHILFYRNDM